MFTCNWDKQISMTVKKQSPDSERLQPPQGPSLTAYSTTFIVSHPVTESGLRHKQWCWIRLRGRFFAAQTMLCFLLPALFLSFFWGSDGETLVHVAMEQPDDMTSCQKPWEEKNTPQYLWVLYVQYMVTIGQMTSDGTQSAHSWYFKIQQ